MINVVEISREVLVRLSKMDYERRGGISEEKFIFPKKYGGDDRISEQELRFLFVEEFINDTSNKFFYSVETPTEFKYKLGDSFDSITCGIGRSASIDMSIFNKDSSNNYKRILNIEFKNQNSSKFSIGKDILKLIHENQNGAFIHLLKNTDSGTLCSSNKTDMGVFDKYYESFSNSKFQEKWQGNDEKYIHLILISLEEKTLIHRKINKVDLNNLENIFFKDGGCGNLKTIKGNGWSKININSLGEVVESIVEN